MLRVTCTALIAAVLFSFGQASSQERSGAIATFTISGTVVEHGNGKPLKDALVNIAPVQQPGTAVSYRTLEDGRFTFTQLQPGKYSLAGRRRGFPLQNFQQNQNYSTAIAAGPGLDSANIVFPLSRGGSITGSVVDEENEPIHQAQVLLFSKGVFSGASQIVMHAQRGTDSAGQFRFPDLNPGTYFVAVQAHPWYAQHVPMQPQSPAAEQTSPNEELDVVYPLTYYAGTVDPTSASAITVSEGTSSSLQFMLRPVRAVHVQVTGLQRKPGIGLGIGVTQLGLAGYRTFSNAQVNVTEDQAEITGIAPGRYIVSASISGQGRLDQTATRTFDITGNETLDLGAASGSSLTGRITFEGSGSPPSHPMLFLHDSRSQQQSLFLSIEQDGSLKPTDGALLLPGRYQLQLQNAPGFYLKSVEAKGATVSAGQIDIPDAASVQLSLVAATGLTSIDGVALKDGKPFGGAMVLLLPKDSAQTDFISRDQSDSDGTFTLPNVRPGRYTLLAIEDGTDLPYQDSAAMKPYLSQGKEVTAPHPNVSPVPVEVLPRQRPGN